MAAKSTMYMPKAQKQSICAKKAEYMWRTDRKLDICAKNAPVLEGRTPKLAQVLDDSTSTQLHRQSTTSPLSRSHHPLHPTHESREYAPRSKAYEEKAAYVPEKK
jgi:hypothetical protein